MRRLPPPLPPADCNWVAERAVNNVELSIGGQRIDKHYQKWWRMYSELYLDESKKATWGKMTTAGDGKTVYLPLIFFFNRNPGLYLPLIALQYHEVRLDFDLASNFTTYLNAGVFKVWANYVYLDTEERRRFAQKGHEYLIEQVQHTGTDTVTLTVVPSRSASRTTTPSRNWCGASPTPRQTTPSGTSPPRLPIQHQSRIQPALLAHHNNGSNCFVTTASSGTPMVVVWCSPQSATSPKKPSVPSTPSSSSSTVRTVSRSRRVSTSTRCSPTTTTPAAPTPVSTRTPSRSSPRSISLPALATSRALITRRFQVVTNTLNNATSLHMFATNYNVLRIQSGMGGLAFSN